MKTVLFWFRNDLRLHDQPALAHAMALAARQGAALLPVFCHAPPATTRWGFARVGPHRLAFGASTLACLSSALAARGSHLLECAGMAQAVLPALACPHCGGELDADGDGQPDGPLPLYEFEPNPEGVLDALLPKYVTARIFNALLQSAASELAARQRAMKSATDNATELIKTYTRLANQARQAEITQEISEIVGGASALADAS